LFVRLSGRDPRYFELSDGTPYIPIGFNLVRSPAEDEMQDVIQKMASHRINYCRIWLDVPPWNIEDQASGVYNEDNADTLDRFLSLAGENGIRVKMCLEHFRDIPPVQKIWSDKSLHHRSNGGPFATTEEFLSSERGQAQFKRKLAFYRSRFGGRPEVFAWELWNEMNCVNGDWLTWTASMLPELHRLFPKNLAAQSLGSFDNEKYRETMYRPLSLVEGNDLAQVHRYLDLGAPWSICHGPVDVLLAEAVRELRSLNPGKPVLMAETGAVKPRHTGCSDLYAKDKAGMLLHDAIFAPFFAGAAGTGNTWWWRESIEAPDLWWHFARFASAVEGVAPPDEGFEPLAVAHDRLRAYALKGKSTCLAWCRDSLNDWRSELDQEKPPDVLKDMVVDLSPCLAGARARAARAYDPWKDSWSSVEVESGEVSLPPFERSIVVRLDLA